MIGQTISHYKVLEQIGARGGEGAVGAQGKVDGPCCRSHWESCRRSKVEGSARKSHRRNHWVQGLTLSQVGVGQSLVVTQVNIVLNCFRFFRSRPFSKRTHLGNSSTHFEFFTDFNQFSDHIISRTEV